MFKLLIQWVILFVVLTSCETDQSVPSWIEDDNLTICQYLEKNREEYSKSYRLLEAGKVLISLCGYNPYGEDYTLFLPTDEAIDRFIEQNQDYVNFEEMLLDTGFIYPLTRYHILNNKVHTDEFPDGALNDSTLSGDRLVTGFYTEFDNQVIKVNNVAPIIKANLKMTNGYIHVISEVLQRVKISGYDWLQQQDDYSILAQAMEYCKIRYRLLFDKYTIFAEYDSIYHRNGIMNIEDLINYVAPAGSSNSTKLNSIYQFTAYHILSGEYYLNDLYWGNKGYWTLNNKSVMINVGEEIKINPGINTYGITISESGDTTIIDYIRPVWEGCNNVTKTGPVHSIADLLSSEPLP